MTARQPQQVADDHTDPAWDEDVLVVLLAVEPGALAACRRAQDARTAGSVSTWGRGVGLRRSRS